MIEVGLTLIATVGAALGGVTVSVADACADPPELSHASVYVYEPAEGGVTACLPEVACEPLQEPLAVHVSAPVLDH